MCLHPFRDIWDITFGNTGDDFQRSGFLNNYKRHTRTGKHAIVGADLCNYAIEGGSELSVSPVGGNLLLHIQRCIVFGLYRLVIEGYVFQLLA